jgi:hypothetical protein
MLPWEYIWPVASHRSMKACMSGSMERNKGLVSALLGSGVPGTHLELPASQARSSWPDRLET